MSRGRVLVVGGGIGGLSTAIAVRNAGYDVHVVELHENVRSSVYGVGIIQPMNALRALDEIGCAQACLEAGYGAPGWSKIFDVDGRQLAEVPGMRLEGYDLPPMNGLTRPKLHEILTGTALEAGVRIQYDATFETLADGPDGVAVVFRDGSEGVYDVVVGADGVRSKVRSYVLGPDLQPEYIGQKAFRVTIPRLPEIDRIVLQEGPKEPGEPFLMAGFVPIAPDLAYMFLNTPWPDREVRPDPSTLHEVMRDLLTPFGGLAGHVRDTYLTDPEAIVLRPEEFLIAPPPWHRGRIVLIGDAVHAVTPHLGQGAAQAIEDGIVLAQELAAHDDLETAFTRYTERRYERCRLVVESSAQLGRWQIAPTPDADHAGLTRAVLASMAQPI
jgi:2-polyprenyl-6-methoxyphenol hydroxylase and related FAD-dependent oxidoreductases